MSGRALTQAAIERRKQRFLEALAECGCIRDSLQAAGLPKATAYTMRAEDETFKAQWNVALEAGCDALEDEAVRRGMRGVDEPVYQGGKQVGTIRKYSDTLLMFILNGRRPEKFKHRHEHTGAGGRPLIPTARELTDDELLAVVAAGRGTGTAGKKEGPPVPGRVH